MNTKKIKQFLLMISILVIGASFSIVHGYGDDTVVLDGGAGCKIPEVVEVVEPDCDDPALHAEEIPHQAAGITQGAEVAIINDVVEPTVVEEVVEPTEEVVVQEEVQAPRALPTPLVFEAPAPIQEEVIVEPVAQEQIEIQEPVTAPAIEEVIAPTPKPEIIEPIKVEVQEEKKIQIEKEAAPEKLVMQEELIMKEEVMIEEKNKQGISSVEKAQEHYVPSVLKAIESNDTQLNTGEHQSATSTPNNAVNTVLLGTIFDNHLREIILVSFIIFLLISLLFV